MAVTRVSLCVWLLQALAFSFLYSPLCSAERALVTFDFGETISAVTVALDENTPTLGVLASMYHRETAAHELLNASADDFLNASDDAYMSRLGEDFLGQRGFKGMTFKEYRDRRTRGSGSWFMGIGAACSGLCAERGGGAAPSAVEGPFQDMAVFRVKYIEPDSSMKALVESIPELKELFLAIEEYEDWYLSNPQASLWRSVFGVGRCLFVVCHKVEGGLCNSFNYVVTGFVLFVYIEENGSLHCHARYVSIGIMVKKRSSHTPWRVEGALRWRVGGAFFSPVATSRRVILTFSSFFDFLVYEFILQNPDSERAPALFDKIVSSMGILLYGQGGRARSSDLRNTVETVAGNSPFMLTPLKNPTDLRVAATRFAEMKKLFIDLRKNGASIAVLTRNEKSPTLFDRFRDTTLFAQIDAFFGINQEIAQHRDRVNGRWEHMDSFSNLGMSTTSPEKSTMLNDLLVNESSKPRFEFLKDITFDRVFLVDDDISQCRGKPSLPETGGPGAEPR